MEGYIGNIERVTLENEEFRRVLYTGTNIQLVVMSIPANEEIGAETHDLDQFIHVEEGEGVAHVDGAEHPLTDGTAVLVPAGARHNIRNTSSSDALKLYTLYGPPEHRDGIIHATKADAQASEEHFDGATTE